MEAVITDIFITDAQKNERIKMRGKYSGNEPGYFFFVISNLPIVEQVRVLLFLCQYYFSEKALFRRSKPSSISSRSCEDRFKNLSDRFNCFCEIVLCPLRI